MCICVSIADRCNRILTEIERCSNRIVLITNYTKMLNVSIYFQVVFFFKLPTTFIKEIVNDSMEEKNN